MFELFGAPWDNEADKLNFHKEFMIIIHNLSTPRLFKKK